MCRLLNDLSVLGSRCMRFYETKAADQTDCVSVSSGSRLETSEENYKKIEAAKFDLVIANANLQEKVVKLQAATKIEVRESSRTIKTGCHF